MQPLIKIQTIPIKIEAQTKRASFQESSDPVPVPQRRPVSRQAPVQQRSQAENQPAPDARVNQNRNAQRAAAADNTGNYLQEASTAVQAFNQSAAVGGGAPVDIPVTSEYQAPVVNNAPVQAAPAPFDYSMDKETFDWNTNSKPQLEFIPASIEYSVAQYPDVIIEYVGEPIYVPASSNPNYVPPPELMKGKA